MMNVSSSKSNSQDQDEGNEQNTTTERIIQDGESGMLQTKAATTSTTATSLPTNSTIINHDSTHNKIHRKSIELSTLHALVADAASNDDIDSSSSDLPSDDFILQQNENYEFDGESDSSGDGQVGLGGVGRMSSVMLRPSTEIATHFDTAEPSSASEDFVAAIKQQSRAMP